MVAEYNGSGTMIARYIHGTNADADDPLIWYDGSTVIPGKRRFLLANHQGSIIAMTSYTCILQDTALKPIQDRTAAFTPITCRCDAMSRVLLSDWQLVRFWRSELPDCQRPICGRWDKRGLALQVAPLVALLASRDPNRRTLMRCLTFKCGHCFSNFLNHFSSGAGGNILDDVDCDHWHCTSPVGRRSIPVKKVHP